MNILFLNKDFYEYDQFIKKNFEDLGANVEMRSITQKFNKLERVLISLNLVEKDKKIEKYQNKNILDTNSLNYDIIFLLSGQGMKRTTMEKLKLMYPDAIFVWYIWDSINNLKGFYALNDLFDYICSFDIIEAKKYNLIYLPLFFIDRENDINLINPSNKYDLFFVGQYRDYRIKGIKSILQNNKSMKKNYIKLYTGWKKYLLSILKLDFSNIKYFTPTTISYYKLLEKMQESKFVLDIPAPNQTGLTMRTIECLGMRKKLITTNKSIMKYDFYNNSNCYIYEVDREFVLKDEDFLNSSYMSIDKDVIKKYSIKTWCRNILNLWYERV